MKRFRTLVLLGAVAALSALPSGSSHVLASHTCGLDDISHTVNTICDNYHNPKTEVQYLACIAKGQCPID